MFEKLVIYSSGIKNWGCVDHQLGYSLLSLLAKRLNHSRGPSPGDYAIDCLRKSFPFKFV